MTKANARVKLSKGQVERLLSGGSVTIRIGRIADLAVSLASDALPQAHSACEEDSFFDRLLHGIFRDSATRAGSNELP